MEKIIAENARLQTLVADKELEIKELRTGRSGNDYVLAEWKYNELNNAVNDNFLKAQIISDYENRLKEASSLILEQSKSINRLIDKL